MLKMNKLIVLLCTLSLFLVSRCVLAVGEGAIAPQCRLSTLDQQQQINLQQFRGKVVYVDFWASWCAPCAKSFPFLNSLHKDFADKGLQVIAVNMDENSSDVQAFLAKYPAGFSVAADASQQCAKNFEVNAMPSSYLIDGKGVIKHVHLGFRAGEAEQLRAVVEQLLAELPKAQ